MSAGPTLDTFDWATLTQAQAKRLRVAAAARERAVIRRFEAGEAGEADDAALRAAETLEEDLHVYALTGQKPRGMV